MHHSRSEVPRIVLCQSWHSKRHWGRSGYQCGHLQIVVTLSTCHINVHPCIVSSSTCLPRHLKTALASLQRLTGGYLSTHYLALCLSSTLPGSFTYFFKMRDKRTMHECISLTQQVLPDSWPFMIPTYVFRRFPVGWQSVRAFSKALFQCRELKDLFLLDR